MIPSCMHIYIYVCKCIRVHIYNIDPAGEYFVNSTACTHAAQNTNIYAQLYTHVQDVASI